MNKTSFAKEIAIGVVINIIASIILAICSLIWKSFALNFMWLSIIFAVIIVSQLVVIVIYIVWRNNSYKSYYYPSKCIKYDYSIDKLVINYSCKNKKIQRNYNR